MTSHIFSVLMCCDYYCPLTVILVLMVVLLWRIRTPNSVNLPPGSRGWPIIGETLDFIMNGRTYMSTRIARYGPVFRSSVLGSDLIVVSGAENIDQIVQGEGRGTVEVFFPKSIRSLIGKGTLTRTNGNLHDYIHKSISRLLNPSKMRDMTPLVFKIIRDKVKEWRRVCHVTSGLAEVKKLNFALDANVLFGLNFSPEETATAGKVYEVFNEAFFSFPINIPGFAYYRGQTARRKLADLLERHLSNLKTEDEDQGHDMMHGLLEVLDKSKTRSNKDTELNLVNIVLEVMLGSQAALASAMCSLLMYLAHKPEVYDTVYREIDSLGLCTQDEKGEMCAIEYANVMAVPYIQKVIKEMLRLYPPVAGSFRKTLQPMKIAGYDLPVGSLVLFSITSTHELSPIFEFERNEFIPARWDKIDEDSQEVTELNCYADIVQNGPNKRQKRKSDRRFHYIPFGAGARRCVGRNFGELCLTIFVIELVRTGRWQLVNGFPEIATCPFVHPKDNLPLRFDPC